MSRSQTVAIVRFFIIVLVLAVLLVQVAGCSAAWWAGKDAPVTVLKLDPARRTIELHNSKDVDSHVLGLRVKHGDVELELDEWELLDTASSVRRANAEQIAALAQVQALQVQYLAQAGANVNALAAQLVPILQAYVPNATIPPPATQPVTLSGRAELTLPCPLCPAQPTEEPATTQPATGDTG